MEYNSEQKDEIIRQRVQEATDRGEYPNYTRIGREVGLGRDAVRVRATAMKIAPAYPGRVQVRDVQMASSLPPSQAAAPQITTAKKEPSTSELLRLLRKSSLSLDEIAERLNSTRGQALDLCDHLKASGYSLHQFGDKYSVEREPAAGVPIASDDRYVLRSDAQGRYHFGVTSDNHLGSKYSRLDVLNEIYQRYEDAGIATVFNAGNWIDGEARFNKHDLLIHGMHQQVMYFLENYPQKKGITTFFVAGDDHEGWYNQREGIDIGVYVEMMAVKHGRTDLKYLGYMESYIDFTHAQTGNSCKALVAHPGGGSSYAISYTSQKSVESYDGGEKPAIAFYGHYHKIAYEYIRNVHACQTGCTEDQTPFMRKKKLAAHIGALEIRCAQNEDGAIRSFSPTFHTFFNQSYYQNRWNLASNVVQHQIQKKGRD